MENQENTVQKVIDTLGVKKYSDLTQEELRHEKELFENGIEDLEKFEDAKGEIKELRVQLDEINRYIK